MGETGEGGERAQARERRLPLSQRTSAGWGGKPWWRDDVYDMDMAGEKGVLPPESVLAGREVGGSVR